MTLHELKSKIESLSRMTEANGCTPAEAQNAAKMAARLRAKLPTEPSFHSQQQFHPHPAQDVSGLWGLFRQAMNTTSAGNSYTATYAWDHIREQSVLDDLDAFLGNQGTRRGTGGSFWSAPRSRADEARRQHNERTLRDKIRTGKVRF